MKIKTNRLFLFSITFLFLNAFFVRVDGVKNLANADECSNSYGPGWMNDPSDSANCIPADACPEGFYLSGGECVNSAGGTSQCDYGYTWNGTSCVANDSCPTGYALVNGECVNASGGASQCDYGYLYDSSQPAGQECVAIDNCPDGSTLVNGQCVNTAGGGQGCGEGQAYSSYYKECRVQNGWECTSNDSCDRGLDCVENACRQNTFGGLMGWGSENSESAPVTADQKAAASKAQLQANTLTAAQNNAVAKANAANAAVQQCTTDCVALRAAADKANADLLAANAAAEDAIAKYNAAAQAAGLNNGSGGGSSNYMLCANGVLGTICEGGGGTPITTGFNSSYSSGGGGFGSYSSGSSGAMQPKCGNGFQDIGGVCFPMTTGLSNAPIYVILSNLFSWLMGLFTTFAVIAFVVSGIQYFMASGDESMAEKAKENATNAVIGIIVGLSGFIIIKAIAAALSGQSMFF